MSPSQSNDAQPDLTSVHVRAAMAGREDSRAWIVEHFTPLLEAQARYRLQEFGRGWCEPEDLVQEVWAVALPRLPYLTSRSKRWTPVLVKFLSTTLLHKANKIVRRYIRDKRNQTESDRSGRDDVLAQVPAGISGVLTRADRRERIAKVRAAIDELEPTDREILILRGIEQLPNQDVSRRLDLQPAAVSMRYRRALDRLNRKLPDSVFGDLLETPARESPESA